MQEFKKARLAVGSVLLEVDEDRLSTSTIERKKADSVSVAQSVTDNLNQVAIASIPKETFRERASNIADAVEKVGRLVSEYTAHQGLRPVMERVNFIRQGLELAQPDTDICPFCGEHTLSADKKDDLSKEVQGCEHLSSLEEEIGTTIKTVRSELDNLRQLVNVEEITGALQELPELAWPGPIQVLLAELKSQAKLESESFECLEERAIGLLQDLGNFKASSRGSSDILGQCCEYVQEYEKFMDSHGDLRTKLQELHNQVVPVIREQTTHSEKYQLLLIYESLWLQTSAILRGLELRRILDDLSRLRDETERFEKAKADERLTKNADEVRHWYDLLHPDEEVAYAGMSVKKGKSRRIELHAESYGIKTNASALLSESHANAVGVSVYLAQLVQTYRPGRFIVMDDPVQSMDNDHVDRFVDRVIPALLSKGYQVVVLSHYWEFFSACIDTHDVESYYEFESYTIRGPVYDLKEDGLKDYRNRFHYLRKGNASMRELAAHTLRRMCERFCKDVYEELSGKPLPPEYKRARFGDLKKLLLDFTEFPILDMNKLDYIVSSLGNPNSHDDQTSKPPEPGKLQSYNSRLAKLITQYLDSSWKE